MMQEKQKVIKGSPKYWTHDQRMKKNAVKQKKNGLTKNAKKLRK